MVAAVLLRTREPQKTKVKKNKYQFVQKAPWKLSHDGPQMSDFTVYYFPTAYDAFEPKLILLHNFFLLQWYSNLERLSIL